MTDRQRIVICDDDDERARDDWAQRLMRLPVVSEHFDVVPLRAFEFAQALEALEERSLRARKSEPDETRSADAAEVFDAADILIIDFDLTPDPDRTLDDDPQRATKIRTELRAESGESVAYLARCYSACKVVVAVNQVFKRRTFDLTLQQFVRSYADLNITQDVLDAPELWTGEGDGFHPWHWPHLAGAIERFERRESLVELDTPVLESLELDGLRVLDIRQLDTLGDTPSTVTFRDIALSSELGLNGRDLQRDEDALQRIAAAGVGRWLDCLILPAQNVIVDAPHLVQRFPSLLLGDPDDPRSWDATTAFDESRLGIWTDDLAAHRIATCDWFQRPTWSWPDAAGDRKIAEVIAPWDSRGYEWAFCEDLSRFRPLSNVVEVETNVPGPYTQRFVAKLDSSTVDYRPRSRLLE